MRHPLSRIVVPFAALTATLSIVPTFASAQSGEACDFVTTPFPSYQQVLDCYNSVPWCLDPSNPLTCDRDNQAQVFEEVLESFSTVQGFADSQADYRAKLAAIRATDFASDYDQFKAFQDLLIDFRNGHWVYVGPQCYTRMVRGFIPLNFGSMLAKTSFFGKSKQIIYLQAPFNGLGTTDTYLAQTGIDLTQFEGKRVISIDGVPIIDYLRNYAEVVRPVDGDAGNGLMEIIEFGTWSFRGGIFGIFPEAPEIEIVLADRFGRKEVLVLPWVFQTYFDQGLAAPPPTTSNAEFANLCFTPGIGFVPPAEGGSDTDVAAMRNATNVRSLLTEVRNSSQRVALAPQRIALKNEMKLVAGSGPSGRKDASFAWGDFAEVPESKRNIDITEILPLTDGARVLQYAEDTVAIQLEDFIGPWIEEVEFGVDFACKNADRLVIDVRNNGGGFVGQVEWLTDYLYPQGSTANNRFVFRDLAASPRLNELRVKAQQNRDLAVPPTPLAPAWNTGQSIVIDPSRQTLLMSAVDEPTWQAPLPGYGNNWVQSAEWTVRIPNDPDAQIFGEWYYDVEPGFDFINVEIEDENGNTFPLAELTGFTVVGQFLDFVPFAFDVGTFAGTEVTFRVTFTSDSLFSDQDGLYDSFGPIAIDFIEVTSGAREDFNDEVPPPSFAFSAEFQAIPSCAFSGYEAGCLADFDTLEPFTDPDWYVSPTVVEQRGTDATKLTQLATLNDRNFYPFNSTPCPGKFEGKNLIVLTNGLNASAGFFGPVALDPIATTVSAGGYPKIEQMFLGQARGGNIRDTTSYFSEQNNLGLFLFLNGGEDVEFEFPVPAPQRNIQFTIEELGTYFDDLQTQTSVRHPKPIADLQIPFWSNSEETDGAAYRTLVSAVEREAIIEPVCGDYDHWRTCFGYGACAKRATKNAIKAGVTSKKDAKRARNDAIRDCVLRR